MPYAIYARRSQDRDERQVQSLDDQLAHTRRLADTRGLRILNEIVESASAKEPFKADEKTPARAGFAQMIHLIQQGAVDGIIAWHPDRLSRNETDAATIVRLIRHKKLQDLQFVNYTFENSPEGVMMLQMALSQSQYSSSKLAVDVWRGMQSKIEKGWLPFRCPEGWKNDAESRTIVKDPERFATIRRFVDLVLAETHPVPQALQVLNEEWGYRTRHSQGRRNRSATGRKLGGGPLSRSSAYKLLHNPFLAGYFVVRGITHRGSHEPMLTVEEFNGLQEILRRQTKARRRTHTFAYTGLIRCKRCDCQVTASLSKQHAPCGPYTYYHCTNARGDCGKAGVREETLEAQIESLLRRITIDPDIHTYAGASVSKWQQTQSETVEDIYTEQTKALADAEKQQNVLLNLKLREMIPDETFDAKYQELEETIRKLRAATDQTENECERVRESALNTFTFLASAHERYLVGTLEEKREIAQALGITYLLDGHTVEIEMHPALAVYVTLQEAYQATSERQGSGTIEPSKAHFESTKHALAGDEVPGGAPEETLSELLYRFFRGKPRFRRLQCLGGG